MKNFPAKWRADEKAEGSFTAIKCEVDQIAGTGKIQMPTEIRAESRFIFDHWLGGRSMGDMRVIREVTSMHEVLAMTAIIPGFTWSDFDHTPEMPTKTNAEEWDLYLTDFATDTYSPLASYLDMKYSKVNGKVVLPQGLWLRYHACNMYAMSSILATNMAAASDEEVVASETACGRRVYTSQTWEKAQQYAIPHRLPGSKVFTKTIALFVIPGASGVGGVGVWIQRREALWEHKPDGTWEGRPRWFLVPRKDVADECWEEPGSKAIPFPALETRKDGRLSGVGEVPWTTSDGTTSNSSEDQSSVVHLAGFFVAQFSASDIRKMTCQSGEKCTLTGGTYFWSRRLAAHFHLGMAWRLGMVDRRKPRSANSPRRLRWLRGPGHRLGFLEMAAQLVTAHERKEGHRRSRHRRIRTRTGTTSWARSRKSRASRCGWFIASRVRMNIACCAASFWAPATRPQRGT